MQAPKHRGQVRGGSGVGGRGGGFTSQVEGAVDAHCWLLLELSQALGGAFVHHQVQGLVQHHQLHTVELPVIHCLHTGHEGGDSFHFLFANKFKLTFYLQITSNLPVYVAK